MLAIDFSALLGTPITDLAASAFIASVGAVPETRFIDDRYNLTIEEKGLAFVATPEGRISAIRFHREGYEGFHQFPGVLPDGLEFSKSRQEVQHLLGRPSQTGGGTRSALFGVVAKWDLFDREGYALFVQYVDGAESIAYVSLMRPDTVMR